MQKKPRFLIQKKDIKWVVTIPAIWEEKSKNIMINASKSAGLIEENTDLSLFLALEHVSFCDQNINEGKPYIICDIGGGTVDICTHKKTNISKYQTELIEVYPLLGGD